jgi:hypothetical protein
VNANVEICVAPESELLVLIFKRIVTPKLVVTFEHLKNIFIISFVLKVPPLIVAVATIVSEVVPVCAV